LTYSQFYEIKRKQAEQAIFDTQQKLAELQEMMAEVVNQEGVRETVELHQLMG
jgi:Na+-transporting NADH:ubiquinone oxidoreductase subunit NqrC